MVYRRAFFSWGSRLHLCLQVNQLPWRFFAGWRGFKGNVDGAREFVQPQGWRWLKIGLASFAMWCWLQEVPMISTCVCKLPPLESDWCIFFQVMMVFTIRSMEWSRSLALFKGGRDLIHCTSMDSEDGTLRPRPLQRLASNLRGGFFFWSFSMEMDRMEWVL